MLEGLIISAICFPYVISLFIFFSFLLVFVSKWCKRRREERRLAGRAVDIQVSKHVFYPYSAVVRSDGLIHPSVPYNSRGCQGDSATTAAAPTQPPYIACTEQSTQLWRTEPHNQNIFLYVSNTTLDSIFNENSHIIYI